MSFDGQRVWFASGRRLNALDPDRGEIVGTVEVPAHAGTAFDGKHLFQIAEAVIQKIDPETGEVVRTIPAPGNGGDSGLAWAEGSLWVGQHRGRRIHQIDPETGAVLRTIESDRFVTGVTWVDGELWHSTWQEVASDVRRIDPRTGAVLERLEMPPAPAFQDWSPAVTAASSVAGARAGNSGSSAGREARCDLPDDRPFASPR